MQAIKKKVHLGSLKLKIVVMVVGIIAAMVISLNVASHHFINTNFTDYAEGNNRLVSAYVADYVQGFVEKAYTVTEEMAHNSDVVSFQPEQQKAALVDTIQRHDYFDLLYVQNIDGMQTAKSSGDLSDRSGRWWYKQMMADPSPFVSKSYYSSTGNVPVTSVFLPIYDKQSQMVGIMGSDIELGALQKMVEEVSKEHKVSVYIVDGEGVVIAHPDKKQVEELYNYKTLTKTILLKDSSGKILLDDQGNQKTEQKDISLPSKLKEITEQAINGKSGVAEFTDAQEQPVLSSYQSIQLPGKSQNWAVITVQNKETALAFVSHMQYTNLLISLVLLVVGIIVALTFANRITKPIIGIKESVEAAAAGDLTVQVQANSSDEVGQLAKSFQSMIGQTQGIIQAIMEKSNLLAASAEQLNTSSQQTAASATETASTMNEITVTVEQVTSNMLDIARYSNVVEEQANRGYQGIQNINGQMQRINQSTQNVYQGITNLNEKAQSITVITDLIKGIADQTNLLALNAAIEAARAGEQGRGFAVVAEEVRKLAEKSAQATGQIMQVIKEIQLESEQSVANIQGGIKNVEDGNQAAQEIGVNFKEIQQAIQVLTEQIQEVVAATEQMASGVENVAGVTEEQTAAMEEVNANADSLTSLAEDLKSLVKRFKV